MFARDVLVKLTLTCLLLVIARSARAQPFTPTINPTAAPITINQNPEKLAVRSKFADQKLVNIAFGATINGGNTKSYAGNLGGRFGYIHDNHQLQIEALGTLGGARREGSITDVDWTTRSAVGRARYDLFLSLTDALFVAEAPRRDVQAGLNVRLQTQAGYLRNLFFFNDSHRLWTELGYDFTYDNFNYDDDDRAKALMNNMMLPEGGKVHSARVFFGYTNKLSPTANLNLGIETLYDFQDWKNVRLNGIGELTSSLTQKFKLGLQSRVLFDNVPVTGKETFDVILVAQLVYMFDSAAATGAPVTVCPACDCSAQVQAARNQCVKESPLRQFGY
ncbi:MAG TPA: DUF481 domain-containing protein [Polyangiales bacterium]|nr:DUF481 domain-containing protein [Polyangiales bacterium]